MIAWKHIRERQGLTRAELAEAAGITTAYMGMLERGQRKSPSLDVAARLARALDTSLDTLACNRCAGTGQENDGDRWTGTPCICVERRNRE